MNSIDIRTCNKFQEPGFSLLQRAVFADMQQDSDEWAMVENEEGAGLSSGQQAHAPMVRLGAFEGDEMVGWTSGWMERGRVFYMANSGVIASRRRQGIYSALLSAMRKHALSEGAVALRSQHAVLNNPVIIAKLRAGFCVSGLSQSAQMGTLVELTLHLSPSREAQYRRRVLPCVAPLAPHHVPSA